MDFSWLLVESVSGVDQSMLHVYRIFASPIVHAVALKSVAIWTMLNTLLSTFHILISEWLKTVPSLHVDLVKVRKGNMGSILRLDHHVRRITLMLASVNNSLVL